MTESEKKKIVEYMNAWMLHLPNRMELKKDIDKILDKHHAEWAPRTSWDPYLNLMYEIHHGVLDRDLALKYLSQIKKTASLSRRAIEMPPHIYSILQDVAKVDKTIDVEHIENANFGVADYDKIRDLSVRMKESDAKKKKDYVKQIVDLVKKKQSSYRTKRQTRTARRAIRAQESEAQQFYQNLIQNKALFQKSRELFPNYPKDVEKEAEWILSQVVVPEGTKQQVLTKILEGLI